jgi:hypothetical protein
MRRNGSTASGRIGMARILEQGKDVMERCPNCGTPGRPGAKFCPTCGFRFPGDGSENESAQDQTDTAALDTDEEPGLFPGAMIDGWPSPPPPAETVAGGWDQQAVMQTASAEPGEMTESEGEPSTWAAGLADSWPEPPTADVVDTPPTEPDPRPDETSETSPVDTSDGAAVHQADSTEAMARAVRLLDELRQTISEIGPQAHGAADLSGVISDLEVAVHPPGAMAADDVAELRDALLAARERPRDIDTIVDLTKRIDAMLALVIAYDRTIAAIERSLDALRGDG